MFKWLTGLFTAAPPARDPLWDVMERSDPLLSYERFEALDLTDKQRPTVKGLIDGTIKPSELDAVQMFAGRIGADPDGVDALVYALQHVLNSSQTTYLFDDGVPVPAARFPKFVDEQTLTVLFNDRVCHLQITSLKQFVRDNGIASYELEAFEATQLRNRVLERSGGIVDKSQKPTAWGSSKRGERTPSITIEAAANEDGELAEPITEAQIARALQDAGMDFEADDVNLSGPLCECGLYNVEIVNSADGETSTVNVWIVPAVDLNEHAG